MRYPAFVAEMALPSSRWKLEYAVRSGYSLTLLFAILAIVGPLLGLVPFRIEFYALVALKLASNTLAWLSLRTERGLIELGGTNVVVDVVCMTGAIHYTGGILSPLLPIYAIEITVIALLTNLSITLLVAGLILGCYGSMAVGVHVGLFAHVPPPRALIEGVDTAYLVTGLAFAALVVCAPTFFVAEILGVLRAKERALQKRTEELVEASRQKAQFLANVTHELRTPIHGICGLSDLVESGIYGEVTPRQREAHAEIKHSARSLLALIDDLIEISRADSGKLEYRPSDVDLAELLPTVLSTARWMKGTRELELRLEAGDALPVVRTDRSKLAQVLVNLVANAVKFTPDGGTVILSANAAGERVELAVSDTGTGIPEAELANIFEPFRQLDASSEREYGGVGLGLAVVRRLADLLGADVSVESEPGRGSTFRVSLPIQATHARDAA